MLRKLHHVAYRCTSAAETTEFHTKLLGLELVHALTAEAVSSTQQRTSFLHIFFAMPESCSGRLGRDVGSACLNDTGAPWRLLIRISNGIEPSLLP